MAISEEEVRHIAELARLELSSDEVEKFRIELSSIIEYMEQLKDIDTSGVTVFESSRNVMREDKAEMSLSVEDALVNAPAVNQQMFTVPKVIDN